jgi:DNA-binding LacI/PurR family transcriptional regulator
MVRIRDIVNKTGFSRVTVSGVLNDRHNTMGISEETAEKVRLAAQELGYIRNELSLSMKTGRSNTIACIISTINGEWGGRILEGALRHLKETPYSIRLVSADGFENEIEAINHIVAGRVSGLFVSNVNPTKAIVEKIHESLANYNIPILSNNCPEGLSPSNIDANNHGAGALAAKHLIELGHKKIAFISGCDHPSNEKRKSGFIETLKAAGIEINNDYLMQGDWEIGPTQAATESLLSKAKSNRPTAILAANHFMAAAVISKATSMGLSIPKDLSVIGITDESLCQITNPPLTTISLNEYMIGSQAMEILIDMANKPDLADQQQCYLIPVELVERESTGPAPKD